MTTVRASRQILNINSQTQCNQSFSVGLNDIYTLKGAADEINHPCEMNFTSTDSNGCNGLCYMFHYYNQINDANVGVSFSNSTYGLHFTNNSAFVAREQECGSGDFLQMTKTVGTDFVYNENITHILMLFDVYHKCSERANAKSISFLEALGFVKGICESCLMKTYFK